MSGADEIDVRIEERVLYLDSVDGCRATFDNSSGYSMSIPRRTWDAKGRPARVKISGEVIL